MADEKQTGLPVAGYQPQNSAAIALVNMNKEAEERVLRLLDDLAAAAGVDKRWLAIGRTSIEQGFMAVNRAVFQPGRVELKDRAPEGSAWVLERADSETAAPVYYAPYRAGTRGLPWSSDHMKALRMARREDAETLAKSLSVDVRIAEHHWS